MLRQPPSPTLFPYTTLFRSLTERGEGNAQRLGERLRGLTFAKVFTSPLRRALRTCDLAGFGSVAQIRRDRKSTRLNSSHMSISYAVFCLKKKITSTYEDFRT